MKIYNLAFLLLFLYPFASPIKDSQQKPNKNKSGVANIIFKSTDGGQTWKDISEGLPEKLEEYGFLGGDFYANGSGLHLRAGNGIYHSTPNSSAPFWEKENFPHQQIQIVPGKTGIFAYNWDGQFLQKLSGTSEWSPVYTNFQKNEVRTIFETAGGTIFIGCDHGLYKSADKGKSWKNVLEQGYMVVTDLVEFEGVLIGAGGNGILRSTDNGEHWEWVIRGGMGKVVERIDGGFAVISIDTQTGYSRIRISLDSGKTWKAIDEGLPPSMFILSIKQMGKYLICGHADGIFRSSDMGKSWQLLLPSAGGGKIFRISVSGNVIYAVPGVPGC
jgi:photosystem II stability/assembly factor-like uncharacterized protein